MVKKAKLNPKALEKAKERANQVNMMQRSSEEMGKFDNTSATSVPMAITALLGLVSRFAFIFYFYFFEFLNQLKFFQIIFMKEVGFLICSPIWLVGLSQS